MKGIHEQITAKRQAITENRATLADESASPAASHDAFERLPRLEKELGDLATAAHTGENAAARLGEMIAKLSESPVKSAELTLSIRDLEVAGFRLRQHLGTKPD